MWPNENQIASTISIKGNNTEFGVVVIANKPFDFKDLSFAVRARFLKATIK